MVALRKRATDRLTTDEFLAWDSGDRSGRRWQLRDGVPEAMAPPTQAHGAIQSELSRLIGNHLLAAGDKCRVIGAPGVVPRVRAAVAAELLRRNNDGRWPEQTTELGDGEMLRLTSIGLELALLAVYRTAIVD
ncbi:MAG TPA: Uma2 family endonuclease [Acetobacteraceae bacterium]|nr:Uma2 family endonuclease [Acetobacteraceae bacterium]